MSTTNMPTSHEVSCRGAYHPGLEPPGPASHSQSGGEPWPGLVVALLLLAACLGCSDGEGNLAANPIVELTDANFQQEVIEVNEPVLVEFWAPWCRPCLEMQPAIEQLAREFRGQVKVARLNIDENPDTAASLDVNAPPVIIVFRDGKVTKRRSGRQSEEAIRELISD